MFSSWPGSTSRNIGYLQTAELALFTSSHPWPLVKARWRDKWNAIPTEWRKVIACITGGQAADE
jgi:hypothetical protein